MSNPFKKPEDTANTSADQKAPEGANEAAKSPEIPEVVNQIPNPEQQSNIQVGASNSRDTLLTAMDRVAAQAAAMPGISGYGYFTGTKSKVKHPGSILQGITTDKGFFYPFSVIERLPEDQRTIVLNQLDYLVSTKHAYVINDSAE